MTTRVRNRFIVTATAHLVGGGTWEYDEAEVYGPTEKRALSRWESAQAIFLKANNLVLARFEYKSVVPAPEYY